MFVRHELCRSLHLCFQRWICIVPSALSLHLNGSRFSRSFAPPTHGPMKLSPSLFRTLFTGPIWPSAISIRLQPKFRSFYTTIQVILAAQGAVQIPSLGIINLKKVVSFAFGYPHTASFEGFVRLRSAARLAVLASQIRNANDDPGVIAPMPQGASQFLLPITTSIEPWSSTLAIVNLARKRHSDQSLASQ